MKKFTLYGRAECHLCDALQEQLTELRQKYEFDVDWVDVDQDAALELKYGFYVPVLMNEGRKVCHYHLDRDAFLRIVS